MLRWELINMSVPLRTVMTPDPTGQWVRLHDHLEALTADRARIAAAIRAERARFDLEDETFSTLARLLRVVEGGG